MGGKCGLVRAKVYGKTRTLSKAFIAPRRRGSSKIESRYQQSDQRKFYVPCPECDTFKVLGWSQVKFEKELPEAPYYACEHCEAKLKESDKMWMLAHGEWRSEAAFNGIAGFHINELYSPWVKHGKTKPKALTLQGCSDAKKTGDAWHPKA